MTNKEKQVQYFREILESVEYDTKLTLFRIVTTLQREDEKAQMLLQYLSEHIGESAAEADAFMDSIGA